MRTIFVSSTFMDMQAERDAIRDICTPLINAEARKHGDEIDFCDLRWGINTAEMSEEESSVKVLDVCFSQIDRCRPPFVILSGYRYGWIPDGSIVRSVVQMHDMVLDDLEKSVTALEIEYGTVFRSQPALVYFREISNPDLPYSYGYEDGYRKQKLDQLRERIKALPNVHLRTYTVSLENGIPSSGDIRTFADTLCADLIQLMQKDWEAYDTMTPFQREMDVHWQYVYEKEKMFTARQADALKGMELLDTADRKCVLCVGDSGSGKSTLLSHIAAMLKERGETVLPVICGLTPRATGAYQVLQLILQYFNEITGSPIDTDNELSVRDLQDRIRELASMNTSKQIYILIDAADQLYADENRENQVFIPDRMPENVHYFMTALKDLKTDILPSLVLDTLGRNEKELVIDGVLDRIKKELGREVKRTITESAAASFPLSIALIVQRLNIMNILNFNAINTSGKEANTAISDEQISIIRTMPETLPSLSRYVFQEAGNRIDPELCKKVSEYIAVSRYGVRVNDLISLCGKSWNSLNFAHFINYLNEDFLVRKDGRYDFMHKSIRAGISEGIDESKINNEICDMLKNLDMNDPVRKQEYMYHLLFQKRYEDVTEYIEKITYEKDTSFHRNAARNIRDLVLSRGTEEIMGYIDYLCTAKSFLYPVWFLVFHLAETFDQSRDQSGILCNVLERVYDLLESRSNDNWGKENYVRLLEKLCMTVTAYSSYAEQMEKSRKYSGIWLDYAKTNLQRKTAAEKKRLLEAYYHRLWAMKNTQERDILLKALDVYNEGNELLKDDAFVEYLTEKGFNCYAAWYGCAGEVYTRLDMPEETMATYKTDEQVRSRINARRNDQSSLISLSGSYINMINAVYAKNKTNYEGAYPYALKAVEIIDSIPDLYSRPFITEWAARVYNHAGVASCFRKEHTDEENDQGILWMIKALELIRYVFRIQKQAQLFGMYTMFGSDLIETSTDNQEMLNLVRQKFRQWMQEDQIALQADSSYENYEILYKTAEVYAARLSKEKKIEEGAAVLKENLAIVRTGIRQYKGLLFYTIHIYMNLIRLADEPDPYVSELRQLLDLEMYNNPNNYRYGLQQLMHLYMKKMTIEDQVKGYYYSCRLYDSVKAAGKDCSNEEMNQLLSSCINRSFFVGNLFPVHPKRLTWIIEYEMIMNMFADRFSETQKIEAKTEIKNNIGHSLVAQKNDPFSGKRKALFDADDQLAKTDNVENRKAWLKAFVESGGFISVPQDQTDRPLEVYCDPIESMAVSYDRYCRVYIAKPVSASDLADMKIEFFYVGKSENNRKLSIQNLKESIRQYGPSVRPAPMETDLYKHAIMKLLPKAEKVLSKHKNDSWLVFREKYPEAIRKAIKQYASHLRENDVIAFIPTSVKKGFKTISNGILFTDKALETGYEGAKHVEYKNIEAVQLKGTKVILKLKFKHEAVLDPGDKAKQFHDLIKEIIAPE